MTARPLIDRLADATVILPNGCWEWQYKVDRCGYGLMKVNDGRGQVVAHRVAYEVYVGPIPPGKNLDHTCHDPKDCPSGRLCRHRRCINPQHLEPVTPQENVRRGALVVQPRQRNGDCPSHEVVTMPSGRRACRACTKRRKAAFHARRADGDA